MRPRGSVRHLSLVEHLALLSGFEADGTPFRSLADARAAWQEHRDALMVRCEPERPFAWWALEAETLIVPDPAEPIDWREWGVLDQRPHTESPARTEEQIVASLEAMAREARLEARRRAYLAAR